MRKIQRLLPDMVQQAPGSGHQDIHAAAQGVDLRIDTDAAEYHRGFERQEFSISAHALLHLGRQLARRCQNEGAYRSSAAGGGCCGRRSAQTL